ncbi:DUF5671 domain-containing protein [Chloroflexota bacterium]
MALYSILYSLFPLLLIIGIGYLLVRSRQNRQKEISSRQALIGYFYSVTAASVIMIVIGLIYFMHVAISRAYTNSAIVDEIILAIVMSIVGTLLCISHIYGRRAYEKAKGQSSGKARKAYHIFMLALSSLTGIVILPLAIYSTLSHHFTTPSRYYSSNPSIELAIAVVIIPIWAYYLFMVIKEARANGTEEESQEAD